MCRSGGDALTRPHRRGENRSSPKSPQLYPLKHFLQFTNLEAFNFAFLLPRDHFVASVAYSGHNPPKKVK